MKIDWLPHGIDTSVFFPRPRVQARHSFGAKLGAKQVKGNNKGQYVSVPDDALLIGIVGTNQIRKDWGTALSVVAELKKEQRVMVWTHVDILERHFSIPALLNDLGLLDDAIVTTVQYPDETMAWCYSACDSTIALGLGEGFGFAAAESLACGTPAIAPNYGGGEFIPKEFLVEPIAYRLEGPYNCIRPVLTVKDWAAKVREVGKQRTQCPAYIDWNNLWKEWEKWLRKGVESR